VPEFKGMNKEEIELIENWICPECKILESNPPEGHEVVNTEDVIESVV